mgnify:CR=1 FL=1
MRPGLDIRVLVDWHRAQRGLIGAGKQAGNAAWYRAVTGERATEVPIHGVPVQTRELFGVLHLKGFVFDDCVLYSGASLNNVYLQKFDRYRFDRYHELHCAALADCMADYVRRMVAAKAVHRLDLPECPATRSLRHEIRTFRKKLEHSVYHGEMAHRDGLAVEALVGVGRGQPGAHVETSLIEALISFQFEVLTTHLNDGGKLPERAAVNGAHAYIGAPYGVYPTRDGWLALAMVPSLAGLGYLMNIPTLAPYATDPSAARRDRDAIKALIAQATPARTTAEWLSVLQPADIWCAEVLDWPGLMQRAAFRQLDMIRPMGGLKTVRGPLRLDGAPLAVGHGAPALGADRSRIVGEFGPHKARAATTGGM